MSLNANKCHRCPNISYAARCNVCQRYECSACWYPLGFMPEPDSGYWCTLCGEEEVYGP